MVAYVLLSKPIRIIGIPVKNGKVYHLASKEDAEQVGQILTGAYLDLKKSRYAPEAKKTYLMVIKMLFE